MDKQCFLFAIYYMFFHLSDIMRYIINDMHIQIIWCHVELLCKCLRKIDRNKEGI